MSTYFMVYTKLRNAPKDVPALELICLCTTPARKLASHFSFEYDNDTTIEDVAFFEKIRDYYKEEYDRLIELKKKIQERAKVYRNMATKAENVEVLNELLEQANYAESPLEEIEEDIDFAYITYCRFGLICNMYDSNCDAYEFYYYYG